MFNLVYRGQKILRHLNYKQKYHAQIAQGQKISQLQVGDYVALKRAYSEEEVLEFSKISFDKNRLHMDREFASKSIFKERICHGLLTGSIFSALIGNTFNGAIYLSQELSFLAPIYINEMIEGKVEIEEIQKEQKRLLLKTTVTKITQGNKLAISGKAKILYKDLEKIKILTPQRKIIATSMEDINDFIPSQITIDNTNSQKQFIENTITNLKIFKEAPKDLINLSLENNVLPQKLQLSKEVISICKGGVGKHDGYTNLEGMPVVREYLANNVLSNEKFKLAIDDVYLTFGHSLSFWLIAAVLADKGDNIIAPSICNPFFEQITRNLGIGIKYYQLNAHNNFDIDVSQIESLIDQNTKFVLVCNPNEYVGSMLTKSKIEDIIQMSARKGNLPIVADEVFEKNIYPDTQFLSFSDLTDSVPVIKIGSLSKRFFSMGWRQGWFGLYGKQGIFDDVKIGLANLYTTVLMPNTIITAQEIDLLKVPDTYFIERMQVIQQNYEFLKKLLFEKQIVCQLNEPKAGVFVNLQFPTDTFKQKIKSDFSLAVALYQNQNIIIYPGNLFISQNKSNNLNLFASLMTTESNLKEFVNRLKYYIDKQCI